MICFSKTPPYLASFMMLGLMMTPSFPFAFLGGHPVDSEETKSPEILEDGGSGNGNAAGQRSNILNTGHQVIAKSPRPPSTTNEIK